MPQIGEVKRGIDIGYGQNRHLHIWAKCLDCSKERWVPFISGKPKNLRCCTCSARNKNVGGENHPAWKGGRWTDTNGYIRVRLERDDFFYPMANPRGYALEHRLIVARALGRNLHRWEIIHHKGDKYPKGSIENRQDNRYPENLQLVTDERHQQITILENRIKYLEGENERLRGKCDKSY